MAEQIQITISKEHEDTCTELSLKMGESFFVMLSEQGFFEGLHCGGQGKCGQCKVRFLSGAPLPTAADRKLLSPDELRAGYRLACTAKLTKDCHIELPKQKQSVDVQASMIPMLKKSLPAGAGEVIVCDLGTTTIAMQKVDRKSHEVRATYKALNPQRRYGSDVIARLEARLEGKDLKTDVINTIQKGIDALGGTQEGVILSGNTAMIYLLCDYNLTALTRAPFAAEKLTFEPVKIGNYDVHITPCLSAFVGGDIYAGIYEILQADKKGNRLLIDLGTNGEMVLMTGKGNYATATAAGPAFEGMASAGIWGADLVSYLADAYEMGMIDENGTLCQAYEKGIQIGEIVIHQEDVRALQLAKAAVRAGIDELLRQGDCSYEALDQIYLAGGFGYYIDPKKAALLGIIPNEMLAHTIAIGNSSLWGSYVMTLPIENDEEIREEIKNTHVINLAKCDNFNEKYLNYINFPLKER